MNLADAIRQAAASVKSDGQQPQAQPDTPVKSTASAPQAIPEDVRDFDIQTPEPVVPLNREPTVMPGEVDEARMPEPPSIMVTSGNVVRLELFLGAEQLNAMLRAVMQGQHSVMTLREAASYLRLNAPALERMATDGEIPAFSIEGRWRFPKATLDEWLAVKSYQNDEEQENVA